MLVWAEYSASSILSRAQQQMLPIFSKSLMCNTSRVGAVNSLERQQPSRAGDLVICCQLRPCYSVLQRNARNSAAVMLVTNASQWRKIGTGGEGGKSRRTELAYGIISRQFTALELSAGYCTFDVRAVVAQRSRALPSNGDVPGLILTTGELTDEFLHSSRIRPHALCLEERVKLSAAKVVIALATIVFSSATVQGPRSEVEKDGAGIPHLVGDCHIWHGALLTMALGQPTGATHRPRHFRDYYFYLRITLEIKLYFNTDFGHRGDRRFPVHEYSREPCVGLRPLENTRGGKDLSSRFVVTEIR
ncbi:hypothetical protein EVAR_22776_1 [Eumeta japonica]|uniref:Uncharacterized protein n=1 Tax=Eumeta variegata TaxID=151549 RepID=A0A4C1USF4_EUMVA|nr:hypothetical protein EVAR_22776_1 [Eumeta japonica]